jgi:mannosylglycerate synthase
MSLVVFPFKDEAPEAVAANMAVAANHPVVDEVWAVASDDGPPFQGLRPIAKDLASSTGTATAVHLQKRIGRLRPGKGDAMNTAIALAAEQGQDRVHFYDADITNFHESWISGAEKAADHGYGVVRHRFPRASTDAMITWFITRPGLASLFPRTFLPRLNQPLGGELLLTGGAVERLAGNSFVSDRSDWGIDTVITHAISTMDTGLYEHHVADGKRHALYGSLDELRTMLIECLDAVASLSGRDAPSAEAIHGSDPPAPVPPDLKQTVGYDIDGTIKLLAGNWTDEEVALAETLPPTIAEPLLENRTTPTFSFMDSDLWFETVRFLLDGFTLGEPAWESLAFRLWMTRVLSYTTNQALAGFDRAMEYLEATIRDYDKLASQG